MNDIYPYKDQRCFWLLPNSTVNCIPYGNDLIDPRGTVFYIHIEQQVSTSRSAEEDFVIPVTANVLAFGEDGDRYVVGQFHLDRILWVEAQDVGFSLFVICDCDSEGMHELHSVLTEPGHPNELREDFEIDEQTDEVLFLHRMILHPDLAPHRREILTGLMKAFGGYTLTAIWQRPEDVPDSELYELGFKKVAGAKLLLKHSSFRNRYAETRIEAKESVFEATAQHEEWLLEQEGVESNPDE